MPLMQLHQEFGISRRNNKNNNNKSNTSNGRLLYAGRACPCPKASAMLVLLWLSMLTAAATTKTHAQSIPFERFRREEFVRAGATSTTSSFVTKKCWECASWSNCAWGMQGECPISIPAWVYVLEKLWDGILFFAATFEVLARGFTLGFGIQMLEYLFLEKNTDNETTEGAVLFNSYRRKVLVSMVAGISLAAFLHGSSIFFPARWREEWFQFAEFGHSDEKGSDEKGKESIPDTTIPLVLYRYILRSVVVRFKDTKGNLSCDDFTNVKFSIDWSNYVWERSETGLNYLWTTLEVLLRGFSLGFGARMLKFLFFHPEDNRGNQNNTDFNRMAEDDLGLLVKSIKHRMLVSAISGISVAAIVHGSSLFVPTQLRDQWLVLK